MQSKEHKKKYFLSFLLLNFFHSHFLEKSLFECFTSKFLIFILQYIQFRVHPTFLENGYVNTPQELFRQGSIELYFLFFPGLLMTNFHERKN
jgi:hypothetical protein